MTKLKPETEILWAAAAALTPKENWTQGANARNGIGCRVIATNPHACCWCVDGAMIAAAGGHREEAYRAAKRKFTQAAGVTVPYLFNDHRTHAEVLEVLYKAAELAEESP